MTTAAATTTTISTMPTKNRNVYEVYARYNGEPAGFCGRYRTSDDARESIRGLRYATVVKRVRISADAFEAWVQQGCPARGWN